MTYLDPRYYPLNNPGSLAQAQEVMGGGVPFIQNTGGALVPVRGQLNLAAQMRQWAAMQRASQAAQGFGPSGEPIVGYASQEGQLSPWVQQMNMRRAMAAQRMAQQAAGVGPTGEPIAAANPERLALTTGRQGTAAERLAAAARGVGPSGEPIVATNPARAALLASNPAAGGAGAAGAAAAAGEAVAPEVAALTGSRFVVNPGLAGIRQYINPSMLKNPSLATRLAQAGGAEEAVASGAMTAEEAAAAGQLGLRGVLGSLGWGAAGITAAQLAAGMGAPSEVNNTLAGAGVGATIGSIFPGIGTGLGAIAGGGLGLISGIAGLDLFGGDSTPGWHEKGVKKTILALANQLSPSQQQGVFATLAVSNRLPDDQKQQLLVGLLQSLPATIQQETQKNQQLYNTLALQAAAADMMTRVNGGGGAPLDNAREQSFNALLPTLPAQIQPLAQWNYNMQANTSADTQQAMQASLMAQPVLDAFQTQLSQLKQLQQQQFASSSTGGGSQSLASLYGG